MSELVLHPDVFRMDEAAEAARIENCLVEAVKGRNCRGAVLGVSGGVDSALTVVLAARALGPERVLALVMPDRDSRPDAEEHARSLCSELGVRVIREEISDVLEALGCYRRRDAAIRQLVPAFTDGHRVKIALRNDILVRDSVPTFTLTTETPGGDRETARMPAAVYRQVVAATNMKQRVRKTLEYLHAEQSHAVVLGTANRLEHELGFFVRGGDGLADVKPIAHLYKTQVYALASHVGVPSDILGAEPTTDTYSLPQTQEEFYFGFPLQTVDLLLYASNNHIPAAHAAAALGFEREAIERVYRDLAGKRRAAARNLADAVLVEPAEDETNQHV